MFLPTQTVLNYFSRPNEKLFDLFHRTPTKITTRCYSEAAVQPKSQTLLTHTSGDLVPRQSAVLLLFPQPLPRDWNCSAYSKRIPGAQKEKKPCFFISSTPPPKTNGQLIRLWFGCCRASVCAGTGKGQEWLGFWYLPVYLESVSLPVHWGQLSETS